MTDGLLLHETSDYVQAIGLSSANSNSRSLKRSSDFKSRVRAATSATSSLPPAQRVTFLPYTYYERINNSRRHSLNPHLERSYYFDYRNSFTFSGIDNW